MRKKYLPVTLYFYIFRHFLPCSFSFILLFILLLPSLTYAFSRDRNYDEELIEAIQTQLNLPQTDQLTETNNDAVAPLSFTEVDQPTHVVLGALPARDDSLIYPASSDESADKLLQFVRWAAGHMERFDQEVYEIKEMIQQTYLVTRTASSKLKDLCAYVFSPPKDLATVGRLLIYSYLTYINPEFHEQEEVGILKYPMLIPAVFIVDSMLCGTFSLCKHTLNIYWSSQSSMGQ